MKKFYRLATSLGIAAAVCGVAIKFDWICSNPSHWFNRDLYCSKRLLPAKDRYPGHLTDAEQVQAVVFELLAVERSGCEYPGEPLPFFLSSVSAEEDRNWIERDAPAAVLSYIRDAFPTARGVSAAEPVSMEHLRATERETGRDGVIFRVAPVDILGDEPVAVVGSYYANGLAAEGFEFRLQKLEGRWTIIARRRLWLA